MDVISMIMGVVSCPSKTSPMVFTTVWCFVPPKSSEIGPGVAAGVLWSWHARD